MRTVFGNVVTSYWNGLKNLHIATLPGGMFIVKVCNSATGRSCDFDMHSVHPGWHIINRYKEEIQYLGRHQAEINYERKYRALLDANMDAIRWEWNLILKKAGSNTIVLVCHEKDGEFCHRRILLDWLVSNGFVNYLLNKDAAMCESCREAYLDYEMELEDNVVMGYTTAVCEVCGGEEDA